MFLGRSLVLLKAALLIVTVLLHTSKADNRADLQIQLQHLAQEFQKCQHGINSDIFDMKLHFLDKNTTCNLDTPAGYYLKKSPGSKRWIIYLEGGWFCTNRQSCRERFNSRMRNLMTSSQWQKTKTGTGILSSSPIENPSWWNANHVLIPYCSSDAWSGNVSRYESGGNLSFLGVRIIDKVIEDLLPQGLYHAKQLLLAGSSAGAIGVLLNVDRVASKLKHRNITVRGLVDSGWYLDHVTNKADPAKTIKEGMQYWRGVVPEACAVRYPKEPWRCYFGKVVYPTLNSSILVFQWLYDETQLALDASGQLGSLSKITPQQVLSVFTLGIELKKSFKQAKVRHVFAPACVYHTILTDNNWLKTRIRGHTLDDAISCLMSDKGRRHHKSKLHHKFKCKRHLVQHCKFPQCNPTCPIPRNPYTGQPYGSSLLPGISLPGISTSLHDNPIQ